MLYEVITAYNANLAKMIKEVVQVPVMTVGGLRSGAILRQLLDENAADMFSLSRPLIMEPDLPAKWQENRDYVATCISCNGCFVITSYSIHYTKLYEHPVRFVTGKAADGFHGRGSRFLHGEYRPRR